MTTTNPVVTKAVVELTFANGVTRRYVLDDQDYPIGFELNAETDTREKTADDASFRSFEPGLRQKVKVYLIGRGPIQAAEPAADPKRVFVAVVDDRHSDTEPYVFATAEQAIAYAKGWAQGAAHYPGDYEESHVPEWLFYARYSPEGDKVWVVEKELDNVEFEALKETR